MTLPRLRVTIPCAASKKYLLPRSPRWTRSISISGVESRYLILKALWRGLKWGQGCTLWKATGREAQSRKSEKRELLSAFYNAPSLPPATSAAQTLMWAQITWGSCWNADSDAVGLAGVWDSAFLMRQPQVVQRQQVSRPHMQKQESRAARSNTVATSHGWQLSTWNVALPSR